LRAPEEKRTNRKGRNKTDIIVNQKFLGLLVAKGNNKVIVI
jgi:hypothetical protein